MEVQREFRFQSVDELLAQFERLTAPLCLARREQLVLRVMAAQGRFDWCDGERGSWLAVPVRQAARLAGCAAGTFLSGAADLERRGVLSIMRQTEPWTYVVNWTRIESLDAPAPSPLAAAGVFNRVQPVFNRVQPVFNPCSTRVQSCSTRVQPCSIMPIGSGETPRAGARPPFVRSSSSLDFQMTMTNEGPPAGEITQPAASPEASLAAADPRAVAVLCHGVAGRLWPDTPDARISRHNRLEVKKLAVLAITRYGESWLLDAAAECARRRPGNLRYLKGIAANQSADSDFYRHFDALRVDCRSPPDCPTPPEADVSERTPQELLDIAEFRQKHDAAKRKWRRKWEAATSTKANHGDTEDTER